MGYVRDEEGFVCVANIEGLRESRRNGPGAGN